VTDWSAHDWLNAQLIDLGVQEAQAQTPAAE
jgi:hypothetical protein